MFKQGALFLVLLGLVLVVIIGLSGSFPAVTGFFGLKLQGPALESQAPVVGPSDQDRTCMMACATEMGCTPMDLTCMQGEKRDTCQTRCNVKKPAVTEETACMESCVVEGCTEFDFTCQKAKQATCEQQCNMIKEPPAKNAEEQCIRDCVNQEAPGTICSASQAGESGNALCQKCAQSCVHLYEGPCINEETIRSRQNACKTCEHCFGEPVNGPSGEGWDCIVDVACKDASGEFGDDPGSGPEDSNDSNGEKVVPLENERAGDQAGTGIFDSAIGAVNDVVESIGNFFNGLLPGS